MKKPPFTTLRRAFIAVALFLAPFAGLAQDAPRPLRIIAFGAHPDDAEFRLAGTAAKWARLGHKVKLVSVTNGDIGHWNTAGGPLAQRRRAEGEAAARRLGIEGETLDIHDGELMPTLENRRTITRLIREWQADMVFCHRPWDYHPDHRYTGILVQDAAFMVTVPYFCPDVPALKTNPVFFYFYDHFTKPYPFKPDIAVSIDEVFEEKLHAVAALASQVYEGGAGGGEETLKKRSAHDPAGREAFLRRVWTHRDGDRANRAREVLIEWYGPELGNAVKQAEAFEICEYGRRPDNAELRRLCPFFPKAGGAGK